MTINDTTSDPLLEDIVSSLATVPKKTYDKVGRPAKLTRPQVMEIQRSDIASDLLAAMYGVSKSTIIRAKRHGYATADEPGAHSYNKLARGRPSGAGAMTEEKRATIAADPSPAAEVARVYKISASCVYSLRRTYGMQMIRRGPLPREVMEEIRKSEVSDEGLARLFDLSVAVVKAVRGAKE